MKYSKDYLNKKVLADLKRFGFQLPMVEVGCGTGDTLEYISKEFPSRGIDLSDEAVAISVRKGINAQKADFLDIQDKFNSIICIDVLEHIEDDRAFVRHFNDVLNIGGKAFILVPSGRMMKDDVLFGHYRRYDKSAIVKLVQENGLAVKYTEMFGYPLFYYARILMNVLYPCNIPKDTDLKTNTLKSSFEHPYDNHIFARIIRAPVISQIIVKLAHLQEIFKNGDKGFAVIVIAEKA